MVSKASTPELMARWSQLRPRMQVLEAPRMRWRIENAAERAKVYLYDEIGWFGVTAGDFVAELDELDGKPLDLHVNSAGGDVFDGLAIYNALANYEGEVTAYVDALAASAASFIVQAAGSRLIVRNASMMIHEAQGFAIGNAEDMRRLADLLDDSSENIAEIYDARAGGGTKQWRDAMRNVSWYRGEAAVEAGLADEIAAPPASNRSVNRTTTRPQLRDHAGIRNQAIAYADHDTAPRDEDWEAPALSDFTDQAWSELSDAEKRRIAGHYVWSASGNPPERFEDLGGPHHRPMRNGVGPAVWAAVSSGRMQQASWSDEEGVRSHLGSHYRQFGETPPWEDTEDRLEAALALTSGAGLAQHAGYKAPLPDLTVLLEKHPIGAGGNSHA